jgi:signal transduction histidine kinase
MLRCFTVVVALFWYSVPGNAQGKVDSLENALSSASGVKKIDVLYQITYELIDVDNNKALEFANEGYTLAMASGDSLRIVQISRLLGSTLRRLERLDDAIDVSVKALRISRRNKFHSEVKILLNAIAIAYSLKADYDKALEFHYQSLIIREEEGDKLEISIALNNIGFVYFKLRNYETALNYWNRALKLRREAKSNNQMESLLINLGTCHIHLKHYDQAQQYLREGLAMCGENCSDQIVTEGQFSLGVSFYSIGELAEAIKHFNVSLETSKKSNNKRFQVENLVYISKIAIANSDYKKAEAGLNEAEAIALTSGYNQLLIDIYKQFSILYGELEHYQNASRYQNRYIKLKDSLIGEELVKNIAKIQTNFEQRENEKTIANKDVIIERQRSLSFAIVIIALLATLLVFVLFRGNRIKKKVNQALSDAKAIIEDQNRQLLNSNYNLDRELKEKNNELEKANESLLRVNDELDNFIYKTSHDIRGPLASLKGMCNVAIMDVVDPLALSYLKKLDITAEKLNTILTRLLIVNQINNSAIGLERIDFVGIVNDVLVLEKKKGLPPRLKVKKHIDESIEYYSDKEFVRIILENLIDNAIKFYNDSMRVEPFVDISVTEEEKHVKIRVVDNGIGISEVHPDKIFQMFSRASERSETGGIGLYITKTATEKLGGSVHLRTSPEGYTEFFVLLPFSQSRVFA